MRFFFQKKKKLDKHQFFNSIEYWVNNDINNLPIINPLKKRVVCTFLRIKYLTFSKNLKEYINTVDIEEEIMDLETLIIDCLKEYEDKARNEGIPDIFINKFRVWNSPHTHILIDSVQSICTSKFYDSFEEKIVAVLDILTFSFRVTLIDAERTINDLNGELEKALKGTIFDV